MGVEEAQAFGVHRVRAQPVVPRQQGHVGESDPEPVQCPVATIGPCGIDLARRPVYRSAVGTDDADGEHRLATVRRKHRRLDVEAGVGVDLPAAAARRQRHLAHGVQARRGRRIGRQRLRPRRFRLVPREVLAGDQVGIVEHVHPAVIEPQRLPAQPLDVVHAVRAQQQRPATGEVALDPPDALLLERLVADGQHLVGDQHVGRQRGRDGEAETDDHARRVVLDRVVDVLADVGEGNDLLPLLGERRGLEPEQCRREVDVGESRVFRVEPRAQLQQRADAAVDDDGAARRLDHAGDDLQQRRLAGAVLADDAERRACHQLEPDAVERAEDVRRAVAAQQVPDELQPPATGLDLRVVLAHATQLEQRGRLHAVHTKSSKCGDSRRKNHRPPNSIATATATATASPHCSARSPASRQSRSLPTSQLNGLAAT